MDANEFIVEVLEDGKVKVTSPGSFSPTVHKDADEFLKHMEELVGGETVKKKLPHQHTHTHGKQTHRH